MLSTSARAGRCDWSSRCGCIGTGVGTGLRTGSNPWMAGVPSPRCIQIYLCSVSGRRSKSDVLGPASALLSILRNYIIESARIWLLTSARISPCTDPPGRTRVRCPLGIGSGVHQSAARSLFLLLLSIQTLGSAKYYQMEHFNALGPLFKNISQHFNNFSTEFIGISARWSWHQCYQLSLKYRNVKRISTSVWSLQSMHFGPNTWIMLDQYAIRTKLLPRLKYDLTSLTYAYVILLTFSDELNINYLATRQRKISG